MKELAKGLGITAIIWAVVGLAVWKSPEVTSGILWLAFWAMIATSMIARK